MLKSLKKYVLLFFFGAAVVSLQDVRAMNFSSQPVRYDNDGWGEGNTWTPWVGYEVSLGNPELTPLMRAIVGEKSLEEIGNLLEKCDLNEINACNGCQYTALQYAVRHNPEVVALLLKKGAEVNKKGNSGWTPLHSAVCIAPKSIKKKVVEILLNKLADPNIVDERGMSPFSYAIESANLELIAPFFEGPIKPDFSIKSEVVINGKSRSLAEWAKKFKKKYEKTKVVPVVVGLKGVGGIKKLEK